MEPSKYRYEAASVQGFIEQVQRYAAARHYFYVACQIPTSKAPRRVDEKLITRYSIARRPWQRKTRYLLRQDPNRAGIHYLRHERFFVIIATHGDHRFREDHGDNVRDLRDVPLKFAGYSIRNLFKSGGRARTTRVQLDKPLMRTVRENLVWMATRPEFRSAERLEEELQREVARAALIPFRGVQDQLDRIAVEMNRQRRRARMSPVGTSWIPRKRMKAKVFVETGSVSPSSGQQVSEPRQDSCSRQDLAGNASIRQ